MADSVSVLTSMKEHHEAHGNHREPLLDGLTTTYDVNLFREAQARALEDKVGGMVNLILF